MSPLLDSENDPARLWAEIHRLRAAVKGPDGYATWQEAALAERMRRVCVERANINKKVCDHKFGSWVDSGIDSWTGEKLPDEYVETYTYADLSVGRFHCTQCGEIGYYTGLWRKFYEEGIPCPGSEGVQRALPKAK